MTFFRDKSKILKTLDTYSTPRHLEEDLIIKRQWAWWLDWATIWWLDGFNQHCFLPFEHKRPWHIVWPVRLWSLFSRRLDILASFWRKSPRGSAVTNLASSCRCTVSYFGCIYRTTRWKRGKKTLLFLGRADNVVSVCINWISGLETKSLHSLMTHTFCSAPVFEINSQSFYPTVECFMLKCVFWEPWTGSVLYIYMCSLTVNWSIKQ